MEKRQKISVNETKYDKRMGVWLFGTDRLVGLTDHDSNGEPKFIIEWFSDTAINYIAYFENGIRKSLKRCCCNDTKYGIFDDKHTGKTTKTVC